MISLRDLAVRVGTFKLNGISFTIPTGKYGVLMGKTGSGKTTILEVVCGLTHALHGNVTLMNRDVTRLKPAQRGIGYVPQDGALFPSLSVREHLEFAVAIRHWPKADRAERACEIAAMLGLEKLLERAPAGLSGGEAQRVALGRALSKHPEVLCLDEPLSALDEETRTEMCEVLETVRERTGVTVLHVTHSLQEARHLADAIFILKDGVIAQNPKSSG
jgi:ABC-type sugar transport system ATPase subunit